MNDPDLPPDWTRILNNWRFAPGYEQWTGTCPGAAAAQSAIPKRDLIEIGGDIAEAASSLRHVERLIDNGLDDNIPEATIKRRVLARVREAMRQLAAVAAECERRQQ